MKLINAVDRWTLVILLLGSAHFQGTAGAKFPLTCAAPADCSSVVAESTCYSLQGIATCACFAGGSQTNDDDVCPDPTTVQTVPMGPKGEIGGGPCTNAIDCPPASVGAFCYVSKHHCACLAGWFPDPADKKKCKARPGTPTPAPVVTVSLTTVSPVDGTNGSGAGPVRVIGLGTVMTLALLTPMYALYM